jgi:hypothetical protein
MDIIEIMEERQDVLFTGMVPGESALVGIRGSVGSLRVVERGYGYGRQVRYIPYKLSGLLIPETYKIEFKEIEPLPPNRIVYKLKPASEITKWFENEPDWSVDRNGVWNLDWDRNKHKFGVPRSFSGASWEWCGREVIARVNFKQEFSYFIWTEEGAQKLYLDWITTVEEVNES